MMGGKACLRGSVRWGPATQLVSCAAGVEKNRMWGGMWGGAGMGDESGEWCGWVWVGEGVPLGLLRGS